MENVAIIAEYNPFHNGHLYQIDNIKHDNLVVALSGNFTERGDIAVANKYTRARWAIEHGASMVVEIPQVGVLSCAEHYAKCAAKVLSMLGFVHSISFGSETGDIDMLIKIANMEENDNVKSAIIDNLKSGMSYPRALSNAVEKYSDICGVKDILSKPNNILGIEYIRALKDTNIIPTTIKRSGNNYNDTHFTNDTLASASSIRENIHSDEVAKFLPQDVLNCIRGIDINYNALFNALYAKMIVGHADVNGILNISEGIDNRIREALKSSTTYDKLLDNIKTKRYTMSRIKRTLLDIILNIHSDITSKINDLDYVTVLAIRQDKLHLLSNINANIITKYNDYAKTSHPFKNVDLDADNLYNMVSNDKITSHQMLII